jgi:membrane protein
MSAPRVMKRIKEIYKSFKSKNVITLAASVSFFGFLSLFPFLVLVTSIVSFFVDKERAIRQVERLLRSFPESVKATVLKTVTGAVNSGKIVSLLSFVALVYSSVAVFGQLAAALHGIMGTKNKIKGWLATLRTFGFFLATVLVLFFLMIGGSALFVLADRLGGVHLFRSFWFTETGTVLVMAAIFALSFRYLSFRKLAWKNVFIAGVITAAVWEVMKILFGLYVSSINGFTSLYGVIGSIFFLMLWLFYSVVIYLVGAHISVEL